MLPLSSLQRSAFSFPLNEKITKCGKTGKGDKFYFFMGARLIVSLVLIYLNFN